MNSDPNVQINPYNSAGGPVYYNPGGGQPMQLVNGLGYDPSYPYGNFGSGVPTQRGFGTGGGVVGGALGNLLIPGLGGIIGGAAGNKFGSFLGKLFNNWRMAQGQGQPSGGGGTDTSGGGSDDGDGLNRSSASGIPGVGVGIDPSGNPARGREWWSNDFGRWDLGDSGLGAGGYNLAGPGGAFGQRGTGFGSGTVGNWSTAIGFGGPFGGGGPVQAGAYMGNAGLARPYSAEEYANLPGSMKYPAPALSQAWGGITQRPTYQNYLSMWHPASGGGSGGPPSRAADLSRHMGQRQTT